MNRNTVRRLRCAAILALLLACCQISLSQKKTTITYKNVTLTYDASLAKEYLAEQIAAVPLASKTDKPDGVAPQHIVISLKESYVPSKRRSTPGGIPRVYFFPTADPSDKLFDEEFPTTHKAAEDLSTYLSKHVHAEGEEIPFLPWADEAQAFIVKRKSIRFRNGRGVLFLTQYEQERTPVNNMDLVYCFQGLTDDNSTYVSAVFPVAAPGLPSSDRSDKADAFHTAYDRYIQETKQRLEKIPGKDFSPHLSLLEDIVLSIKVSEQ
ncbi:MAG TPA: hypothetical protein VEO56_10380 [Bacteroidota bacterium]|nr:hypothetical protein [Bacteroidota bacterium]